MDYSMHKLGYHLNIHHILEKMIELDKLKSILLDQN